MYQSSIGLPAKLFYFVLLWIPFIATPQVLWVFVPMHRIIIAYSILLCFLMQGYKAISIVKRHGNVFGLTLFLIFAYFVFWSLASFFTKRPEITLHMLGSLSVRVFYFIVLVSAFSFVFSVDSFWKYFSFYHVVVTLLSLLLFILLGIGVSLPHTRFALEDLSGGGLHSSARYLNYYIGFATSIFSYSGNKKLIRIMGFCDEGGAYAAFILPFLVYLESSGSKFRFKTWVVNILRIGLFLSFSLGGWLSYIFFMSIRIVFERNKLKYVLRMISVTVALILIGLSLYILFPAANWALDNYLFERFLASDLSTINTEHGRMIAIKENTRILAEYPIIGTGPGQSRVESEHDLSSITILATNGIVGTFLFLLPWIVVLLLSLKMALEGNRVWFYVYVTHLTSLIHRGSLSGFFDFLIAASIVAAYMRKEQNVSFNNHAIIQPSESH